MGRRGKLIDELMKERMPSILFEPRNLNSMTEEYKNIWFDGQCNDCGYDIVETSSESKDYKNKCTNPVCENNEWHHIYCCETLSYYTHG